MSPSYCHLDALDKTRVDDYIRHRLTIAGAQNLDIFDTEAIDAIFEHSDGIPRLINMLCDTALVYGYADDVKVIGRELIGTVAKARHPGKRRGSQVFFSRTRRSTKRAASDFLGAVKAGIRRSL